MGNHGRPTMFLRYYPFGQLIWICRNKKNVLSYFWQSCTEGRGGAKSSTLSQNLQKRKYWNVKAERALRSHTSHSPYFIDKETEAKVECDFFLKLLDPLSSLLPVCHLQNTSRSFAGGTGIQVLCDRVETIVKMIFLRCMITKYHREHTGLWTARVSIFHFQRTTVSTMAL